MTHTPGPWTAHPDQGLNGGPWIEAAKSNTRVHIAHVSNGNEANARLIAAAPEMLQTLKAVDDYIVMLGGFAGADEEPVTVFKAVRAIIAKAEGRS